MKKNGMMDDNKINSIKEIISKVKKELIFDKRVDIKRKYYNLNKYFKVLYGYMKDLKGGRIEKKNILLYANIKEMKEKEIKEFIYSLAPLSHALHLLDNDVYVSINYDIDNFDVLKTLYDLYKKKDKDLMCFIGEVKKKVKSFDRLFKAPDYIISVNKGFVFSKFFSKRDIVNLDFNISWIKEYRKKGILRTSEVLLKQLYNIKKKDIIGLGLDLIPKKLSLPLEDYLDSYQIIHNFLIKSRTLCRVTGIYSYTQREKQTASANRIAELVNTIFGCELTKWSDEIIFKVYKRLSKKIKGWKLLRNHSSATFFIRGEGFYGKHAFGEIVGYPILRKDKKDIMIKNKENKIRNYKEKMRWITPGMIVYQLPWYSQSRIDKRKPISRVGFTETLPIDIFIETNNIDWIKMDKRNNKIIKLLNKCKVVLIKSDIKVNGYRTDLRIILEENKKHSKIMNSGADIRSLYNKDYLKKGVYVGNMANIPGGEAFTTPKKVYGRFIGDVVISIDKSYPLVNKKPLVVDCRGNRYIVIDGDKKIIKKLYEKRKEAQKLIEVYKKNKVLPEIIIKRMKDNFYNLGEFAINTHPTARLCRYLIVNEKIANMIHIALGSGFEAEYNTTYHYDIVIDAKKQRLDIYGLDKKNKKIWILKRGRFVI